MRKRGPLLLAAIVGALLTIPATYAVLRAHDVLFKAEANPATVIFSERIAMFWRLAVGAYIAPMVGGGVYALARHDLARTMKILYVASFFVAGMIAVQGLLFP